MCYTCSVLVLTNDPLPCGWGELNVTSVLPQFPFPSFPQVPNYRPAKRKNKQLDELHVDSLGWDSNPGPWICKKES